ncbi:MAG: tetratricopeptide repeat protein [Acidobacteriaceae bacterium]
MESTLLNLTRTLKKQNFATIESLNSALAQLTSAGSLDALEPMDLTEKEMAQELAYDAMEADSPAKARKLAQKALALDPDCVDALVLLAGLESRSPQEAIESLRKAVQAGERSLGADFIRKNKGYFWLILETRPWMRAMQELADMLRSQKLNDEAIRIYEKMLDLNPNDNQGVRDLLLGLYLATSNLDSAAGLLGKYERDSSASFAWGRVLERFLKGDLTQAASALKKARKSNPHVELFLIAKKPLPDDLPEMYSLGSEEEAIVCMDSIGFAWTVHNDALLWLMDNWMKEQIAAKGGRSPLNIRTHRKKST